ncbi:MAG TPA: glycerol dehydrogenase [Syntrophobacteraceae bacterium]|nr:glycerol dehydrogenase [Syntrophobacteraceae bacterium]
MLKKALFPGKYIQGPGALDELPALIKLFGSRGLILASGTAYKKVLPESGMDLKPDSLLVERFAGECCEKELSRLAATIREKNVDVLVGMGGGKTIDTAKIAADRANIPVLIVPTIASTDAPCSGCAVLYSEQGVYETVIYQRSNPAVVLVDTEIIVKAPVRFLVAGMGDALATWFEARSCSSTQSENACGGLSTMTGLNLARLCYDTLLQYGAAARIAAERQLITPALEHIVEANILLSGIGFESGGLASAHSIHNGLTALEETHAFYHGEKVAFGVLAGLQLTDASPQESTAVFSFYEEVGLPTTLADIGLQDFDHGKLMPVAEKACAPGECIHHEAGRITPKRVLHAMLAADAVGRYRKNRPGFIHIA